MKKLALIIVFSGLFLVGCNNDISTNDIEEISEAEEVQELYVDWYSEVDEVVGSFIEAVLNFEERLAEDILNSLTSYIWQRTETTHFGLREVTEYSEFNGVVFTNDGWVISFGDDRATRFAKFEIRLDSGGRHTSENLSTGRILPYYDFSININDHFLIETDEVQNIEEITRYFLKLTNLTLTRDLSEETEENRIFLDELRAETNILLGTTVFDISERETISPILYNGSNPFDGYTRIFSVLSYRIAIVDNAETIISSANIGLGNTSSHFVRTELNQNILNDLLAELEVERELEALTQLLLGEWREFDEWNGNVFIWHMEITPSDTPAFPLFFSVYDPTGPGGGIVNFRVIDGRYMEAGDILPQLATQLVMDEYHLR